MYCHLPGALALACITSTVLGSPLSSGYSKCLPVVDLGYELHQALSYDNVTQVYKFQNIRYGRPPVGDLRFRAPVPPESNRDTIQTGSESRICPQGVPDWQSKAFIPIAKYSNPKNPFSLAAWEADILNSSVPSIDFNANATEDCLFLDVHVAKKVLHNAQKKPEVCGGTPVLVFIHGGGYDFGSKMGFPTPEFVPSGLLEHSKSSEEDMIFVSLNYRLGALGFLAGSEVAENGDLNAGLLDQRLALEWVQNNIHLFGGDKDRVTAMGESAGGGSILLHMATSGPTPFASAIPQSPAYMPGAGQPANAFAGLLAQLNVSTLAEARAVDEKAMIAANAAQIKTAPWNNYIYGPVVDGKYVAEAPNKLLRKGKLDQSVKVLAAHNMFEGASFFDATVKTEDEFRAWVKDTIPILNDTSYDDIITNVYPPQFDGTLGYVDQSSRQMAVWGESVIDCNFNTIGEVFDGQAYAFEFGVAPGFHTQDLKYTFNDPTVPAAFPEAQNSLQRAIVSFVQTGVPLTEDGQPFPLWGSTNALVNITSSGAHLSTSKVNSARCKWWQDTQF